MSSKNQDKEAVFGKKTDDEDRDIPSKEYQIQPIDTKQAQPDHFKATPGPVIPQDMSVFEKKLSSEEIKVRTEELNKKKD